MNIYFENKNKYLGKNLTIENSYDKINNFEKIHFDDYFVLKNSDSKFISINSQYELKLTKDINKAAHFAESAHQLVIIPSELFLTYKSSLKLKEKETKYSKISYVGEVLTDTLLDLDFTEENNYRQASVKNYFQFDETPVQQVKTSSSINLPFSPKIQESEKLVLQDNMVEKLEFLNYYFEYIIINLRVLINENKTELYHELLDKNFEIMSDIPYFREKPKNLEILYQQLFGLLWKFNNSEITVDNFFEIYNEIEELRKAFIFAFKNLKFSYNSQTSDLQNCLSNYFISELINFKTEQLLGQTHDLLLENYSYKFFQNDNCKAENYNRTKLIILLKYILIENQEYLKLLTYKMNLPSDLEKLESEYNNLKNEPRRKHNSSDQNKKWIAKVEQLQLTYENKKNSVESTIKKIGILTNKINNNMVIYKNIFTHLII